MRGKDIGGPVNWFIPPEIRSIVGHFLTGVLAGGLFVLTICWYLGVFESCGPKVIELQLRLPDLFPAAVPVVPTVTPVPTPDKRGILYTAKKKKKKPESVDVTIDLFEYGSNLYGSITHICCGCALTHKIVFQIFKSDMLELPKLLMRWTTDEQKTERNRREKFGLDYKRPSDPFGRDRNRWNDYLPEYDQ